MLSIRRIELMAPPTEQQIAALHTLNLLRTLRPSSLQAASRFRINDEKKRERMREEWGRGGARQTPCVPGSLELKYTNQKKIH